MSRSRSEMAKIFWKVVVVTAICLSLARYASDYLGQTQNSLIALEAKTGKMAWSVPLSERESLSYYTTALKDRVFVGMATDKVYEPYEQYKRYQIQAFSAASGQKLWTFSPTLSDPKSIHNMVNYFPPYAQGETLWLFVQSEKAPTGPTSDQTIAVGRLRQQVAPLPNIRKGQIIALDITTGEPRWTIERDWNINSPPRMGLASSGDRSVILRITPTQKIWLETYLTSTGKKLWQTQVTGSRRWEEVPSNLYESYDLVANKDMIFLYNDFNETIKGYDGETGKLKFEIKSYRLLPSNPDNLKSWPYSYDSKIVVSDSTLYYRTGDSRLEAFDSSTGTSRWSVDLKALYLNEHCDYNAPEFVAEGVYIVCSRHYAQAIRRLLFLDNQTGRQQWVKLTKYSDDSTDYDYFGFENGIAIDSKFFAAWIQKIGSYVNLSHFIGQVNMNYGLGNLNTIFKNLVFLQQTSGYLC